MDKDLLAEIREKFRIAYNAEEEERRKALDDLKFSWLGEQWPESVKRDRERDGRPCLTINRMPAFMRQVINDSRMNRPRIRVLPLDDKADFKTAEIFSGIIRNIELISNADVAYDTAIEFAVSSGRGYFRIDVDYATEDSFDLDILIRRVANPFTIYGDPYSTETDASDWNFAFVTDLMPKSEFKRKYKDAQASDFDGDMDEKMLLWYEEDMIRIAEYWQRDEIKKPVLKLSNGIVVEADNYVANKTMFDAAGITVVGERDIRTYKVTQHVVTGSDVLETNAWAGKYIPICPVYGEEFNVEGKRYFNSLIRHAKDAQRMFNYWRTSATESVALAPKAPFIGPVGAFDTDAEKWATANIKSHAYIEYDGQIPPQRQPPADVPVGAIQEALNASDDMKAIMGLYDASLGARSNETSGRAILARQREGDIATFHFIDNLARAQRYAGKVLIDLIPKIYDKPRIIRVLGEDGEPQTVQINQPVQQDDGTTLVYDLSAGKYDVAVSSGPSFTTRREEAAVQMQEMLRVFPQAALYIGDLVAKNLDWPGADEIAKRLRMMNPVLQGLEGTDKLPPEAAALIAQGKAMIERLQQENDMLKDERQKQMAELQAKKEKDESEIMLKREKDAAYYIAEQARITSEMELKREQAMAELNLRKEIEMAKLEQQKEIELMLRTAELEKKMVEESDSEEKAKIDAIGASVAQTLQVLQELGEKVQNSQPVAIRQIRDENGRLIGGVRVMPDGTEQQIMIQ